MQSNKIFPSKQPDVVKEYNKKYNDANREKIRALANRIVTCEVCGISCNKSNFAKHQKTKNHRLLRAFYEVTKMPPIDTSNNTIIQVSSEETLDTDAECSEKN